MKPFGMEFLEPKSSSGESADAASAGPLIGCRMGLILDDIDTVGDRREWIDSRP